jgi:hypothetical protein
MTLRSLSVVALDDTAKLLSTSNGTFELRLKVLVEHLVLHPDPVPPENSYLLTHNDLRRLVQIGEFAGICDDLPTFSIV